MCGVLGALLAAQIGDAWGLRATMLAGALCYGLAGVSVSRLKLG